MKTAFVQQRHSCGNTCGCGANTPRGLASEVAAELKRHPDLIALVNEETAQVWAFKVPVDPWALSEDYSSALRDRVSRLATELDQLEARRAPKRERLKAREALDAAQRELDRAEYQRRYERRRQQIGGLPPLREVPPLREATQ
jgi:hypothetical protein